MRRQIEDAPPDSFLFAAFLVANVSFLVDKIICATHETLTMAATPRAQLQP